MNQEQRNECDEEAENIVRSSDATKDNDGRLKHFDFDDPKQSSRQRCHQIIFWGATTLSSLSIILFLEILNTRYDGDGLWIRLYGTEDVGGSKWCEAIDADLNQFMIEPWNSRSVYPYVAWGCFLVVLGVSDLWHNLQQQRSTATEQAVPSSIDLSAQPERTKTLEIQNPLLYYPHITVVNGIFNVLHGLGAFWNHACECDQGYKAGLSGMLSVTIFPLVYIPVQLLTKLPLDGVMPQCLTNSFLSMIPPIGQTLFYLLVWFDLVPAMKTFIIVMGCTVAMIPLSVWYLYCIRNKRIYHSKGIRQQQHTVKLWLYAVGLLCFGLGHLAWQLDVKRIWCSQTGLLNVLQGHVVWHLLCAFALVCVYMLYRSEEVRVVVATTGSTLNVGSDTPPASDCADRQELP